MKKFFGPLLAKYGKKVLYVWIGFNIVKFTVIIVFGAKALDFIKSIF